MRHRNILFRLAPLALAAHLAWSGPAAAQGAPGTQGPLTPAPMRRWPRRSTSAPRPSRTSSSPGAATSTSIRNWATRKRAPPSWWPTICARWAWR